MAAPAASFWVAGDRPPAPPAGAAAVSVDFVPIFGHDPPPAVLAGEINPHREHDQTHYCGRLAIVIATIGPTPAPLTVGSRFRELILLDT